MRPTGQRWHLKRNDQNQLNGFIEHVKLKWTEGKDLCVQFMDTDRTTDQNSMFFGLYGDISRQSDDKSVRDVRTECKLHYGIPILRAADPAFCTWYDHSIKGLNYEDKLLLMEYMDVTSLFTKEQASEYIDTILKAYTEKGYALARE